MKVTKTTADTCEDSASLRRQLLSQAGTDNSAAWRCWAKGARPAAGSPAGDSHAPRGVELSEAVSTYWAERPDMRLDMRVCMQQ